MKDYYNVKLKEANVQNIHHMTFKIFKHTVATALTFYFFPFLTIPSFLWTLEMALCD